MLKITPEESVLPNSSPEVLQPLPGCGGIFQVVWMSQLGAHALLFQDSRSYVTLLATHHNGHSCRELASRMVARETGRAVEQLEYIQRCGGTARSSEALYFIITSGSDQEVSK